MRSLRIAMKVLLLFLLLSAAPVRATPSIGAQPNAPKWKAGEIIVKFRPASDPHFAKSVSGSAAISTLPASVRGLNLASPIVAVRPVAHPSLRPPKKTSALLGTYVIRFADEHTDITNACRILASDPDIEYAEPNYALVPDAVPNDPYFSSSGSWGQTYDDQWGLKITHVPEAWDLLTNANQVLVAVVDSGIDFTHPDLAGQIATNGWNFLSNTNDPIDDFGHGTFVAGIIAAKANNGIGIAGVAPNVKILPLKVFDSSHLSVFADTAASAIDYARSAGASVINISFSANFGISDSQALQGSIARAYRAGIVIVAAAGNGSSVNFGYPASGFEVIVVGASSHDDRAADFSNFGPHVDVFAPGGDSGGWPDENSILSLRAAATSQGVPLDGCHTRWSGTSFAAPFVAGVVAMLKGLHPQWGPETIRQVLRSTADDLLTPGWDMETSYGRVNALAALQCKNALGSHITNTYNFSYYNGRPIYGVVGQNGFHHYTFEVGPGLTPTNWTLISSNATWTASVTMGWDTSLFPSGTYSVRLTAFDTNGTRFEDRVIMNVYHPNLNPPSHTGWPQATGVANASAPVAADLDGDRNAEVLWAGRFSMKVKDRNGSDFPGWPQSIYESPTGPPSVADLDGDGTPEIGLISGDGSDYSLYLWHKDGRSVPGWPKSFKWYNGFALDNVSPVFADVDDDGFKDIIWFSSTTNGETVVHVDRYNGTSLPGWPVTLPASAGNTFCPPAVADVDGDGLLDIALITFNGEIFLLHHDGKIFDGWPVHLQDSGLGGGVAFADLDHDGQLEIFADTYEGFVSLYKVTGEQMPGWPQKTVGIAYSPAFGDLDGDGKPEIVVGGNGDGRIYVFRANGSLLPGWPQFPGSWVQPPIVADLDGDGHLDVASSDGKGFLHAWSADGIELGALGFPIQASTGGWGCYSGPVVGDVNNDGKIEILVFGENSYGMWDLGTHLNRSLTPWPTMLGDNAHQSRYAPAPRLSIAPYYVVSNATPQLTVYGDYFLKGMRVTLGTNAEPVISETVTSITFAVTGAKSPGWDNLTVSNVNSSSTTVSIALVVPGSSTGDDDADGVPNWQELVAGTDPEDPRSFFAVANVRQLAGGAVTFCWPSVTGRQYTIYYSTNLSSGFLVLTNSIAATPPTNHFIDSVASQSPARFYRLGVQ
jgi:subtilisin family serine protease